jgi:hypothetical protein
MEPWKRWLNILTGWPILVGQALLLAVICWPLADHWISYFWLIVLLGVLAGELVNKLFSPKRQTVSNNIRDESVSPNLWHRVLFWAMISVWLWFSVTLALHFMKKLWIGG